MDHQAVVDRIAVKISADVVKIEGFKKLVNDFVIEVFTQCKAELADIPTDDDLIKVIIAYTKVENKVPAIFRPVYDFVEDWIVKNLITSGLEKLLGKNWFDDIKKKVLAI
jgi:hypothetical protein